ncbi:MAG TPA: ABC transporter ATP-binding protein [Bacteroidota bacterium]|nr:ABC transporter ATP-binding protein [Bacteroidota bacterium]
MELLIENITKQYTPTHRGLSEFSLRIGPGILGLLGPNGAGKSTLMRILATTTRPTSGRVLWNGIDIRQSPNAVRETLGYLPQDFGVYPNLSAREFLEYIAAAKGLVGPSTSRRIDELLELVNLTEYKKRPLGDYSGGMKQRVGIAQALLNDPKLLIVDEPTAGLDPEERIRFRNLLSDLSGDRIIILSTHIVSDVEAAAKTIALIAKGKLVAHSSPEDLLASIERKVWNCVVPASELAAARKVFRISSSINRSDGVHLRVIADSCPAPGAEELSPNLEDAYLYYISEGQSTELARTNGNGQLSMGNR